MQHANPVQRLRDTHPNQEIWWDSSPLIYENWLAGPGKPYSDARLFLPGAGQPGLTRFAPESVLQGATTNQPLTWQVIDGNPELWAEWLRANLASRPLSAAGEGIGGGEVGTREAMWRLFVEVAARGADRLAAIFEASDCQRGQICCQVDPRDITNGYAMLAQAHRVHAARPNIMVKMPGSKEGIDGVRILTSEGIPTNVTLGFTVSQMVAVGKAAQAGLEEARRRGTDLRHWRSCATIMLGRYEDAPAFTEQARQAGVELSEADIRWAGIAIFRKSYRLIRERGYPTRMLGASMRVGPTIDGETYVWHLEKLAGFEGVLTVFPNILETFLVNYADRPLEPQIDEPVPEEVLERLLRVPYFAEAYDENGIAPEDWIRHPALVATANSFVESMEKVEGFAAQQMADSR
jgi:transaldolase